MTGAAYFFLAPALVLGGCAGVNPARGPSASSAETVSVGPVEIQDVALAWVPSPALVATDATARVFEQPFPEAGVANSVQWRATSARGNQLLPTGQGRVAVVSVHDATATELGNGRRWTIPSTTCTGAAASVGDLLAVPCDEGAVCLVSSRRNAIVREELSSVRACPTLSVAQRGNGRAVLVAADVETGANEVSQLPRQGESRGLPSLTLPPGVRFDVDARADRVIAAWARNRGTAVELVELHDDAWMPVGSPIPLGGVVSVGPVIAAEGTDALVAVAFVQPSALSPSPAGESATEVAVYRVNGTDRTTCALMTYTGTLGGLKFAFLQHTRYLLAWGDDWVTVTSVDEMCRTVN